MAPKKVPTAKRGNSRKASPPPPTAGSRTGSHRTGPWVSLDLTDTLIASDPSPTEVANAIPVATPATAASTVSFDPDLYVINTPLASRSSSGHPSPFARRPLLRGPGHLGERYDFHRIVKAKNGETSDSTITPPSAPTTPIVNLPEGVTEEMMMEDIRASTGIRVRAQERHAGPPAVQRSASSTEGLTQAQVQEHDKARDEARRADPYSGLDTDELERRLEDDRVQAEEDRRLLQDLNSSPAYPAPAVSAPAEAREQAAEVRSLNHRAPVLLHRHGYTDPTSTLQQFAAIIGVSAREVLCHSSRKRRHAVVIAFLLHSVFGSSPVAKSPRAHTPHCAFRLSPVVSELLSGALLCEVSTLGMTCLH